MNLKKLNDTELLARIQTHVHSERQTLTIILHHLKENERRKLFSELGYQSLFDYMVSKLKYSRGEAGRKIQAVRLLKEIPQIEEKIESGAINLTHICQVQSFSYQRNKVTPQSVTTLDKIKILEDIENTSTRESEKIFLELSPEMPLPLEKERQITSQHTEMKFVIDESLKISLEEVRCLLGTRAIHMTFAELIQEMASLSITSLKRKRFGKKRTANLTSNENSIPTHYERNWIHPEGSAQKSGVISRTPSKKPASFILNKLPIFSGQQTRDITGTAQDLRMENVSKNLFLEIPQNTSSKTLSQKTKHYIWRRDQGRCTRCSSRHNLNIDHIHPRGLGGDHSPENLRLLCFHCNQRRSFVTFGIRENGKPLLRE